MQYVVTTIATSREITKLPALQQIRSKEVHPNENSPLEEAALGPEYCRWVLDPRSDGLTSTVQVQSLYCLGQGCIDVIQIDQRRCAAANSVVLQSLESPKYFLRRWRWGGRGTAGSRFLCSESLEGPRCRKV